MDPSTDVDPSRPGRSGRGGGSGSGSDLNPAAPRFFPSKNARHQVLKVTLNPSFHYYLQYPPPAPPFSHPFPTYNYHFTPTSYTLSLSPLPEHHGDSPAVTTDPNPNVCLPDQTHLADEAMIEASNCKRRIFSGRGKARVGHGGPGSKVGFYKKQWRAKGGGGADLKHAVVPVQREGQNTTLMIRNIPNRYTREMLMEFLDDHCNLENMKEKTETCINSDREPVLSAFDFLYLPMDFRSGLNKGYAFVNFTHPTAVWRFHIACSNQAWQHFNSRKRLEIALARIQGKGGLVRLFERMSYPCEEYSAVCFSPARDGSRDQSVEQTTVGKCCT